MPKQFVVTPAQMKTAEAMCEKKGTSCGVLMRNVGSAIARHISRIAKPCRTAVLVGSGNNGGDGFALAHNLRKRGFTPTIIMTGASPKTDLAKECFEEYRADYERVLSYPDEPESVLAEIAKCGVIADCVYGTGFHGKLNDEGLVAVYLMNSMRKSAKVFSVDIPSGLNGDTVTGEKIENIPVSADYTIAFHRKKPIHFCRNAKDYLGEIIVADIGIDDALKNTGE